MNQKTFEAQQNIDYTIQHINQQELRTRLQSFLEETGIRQAALSRKLGMSSTALANFKCGNFNLSEEKAKHLNNLIQRGEMIWKKEV